MQRKARKRSLRPRSAGRRTNYGRRRDEALFADLGLGLHDLTHVNMPLEGHFESFLERAEYLLVVVHRVAKVRPAVDLDDGWCGSIFLEPTPYLTAPNEGDVVEGHDRHVGRGSPQSDAR